MMKNSQIKVEEGQIQRASKGTKTWWLVMTTEGGQMSGWLCCPVKIPELFFFFSAYFFWKKNKINKISKAWTTIVAEEFSDK